MLQNDAQSELRGVSAELRGYPSWQHPFQDRRIYIHPAVIRTLSSEALNALKKKPSSEIGGIFWGKMPAGPNQPIVITDAELVPSEDRLYNNTPEDARNLGRAMQNAPPATGPQAVGYFRSHVRNDLCLSPQDQAFIEQEIPDRNAVFLIIKPFEIGICMAAFFFWQEGRLQTDVSDLEVPFLVPEEWAPANPSRPPGFTTAQPENDIPTHVEKTTPASPKPRSSSVGAVPQPRIQNSPPETAILSPSPYSQSTAGTVHKSSKWPRPYFILTLVFILGACAVAYLVGPLRYFRHGPNTRIGLQAVRTSDGQLNLSWNRNSPVLLKAEHAKLTITDHGVSRELALNKAQLRDGKILYSTTGDDVQFQLAVYAMDNRSEAETVMVLSPTTKSPAEKPIAAGAPKLDKATAHSSNRIAGTESRVPGLSVKVEPPVTASPSQAITRIERNTSAASQHRLRTPDQTKAPESMALSRPKPVTPIHELEKPVYVPPRPIQKVLPDMGPGFTTYDGERLSMQVRVDEAGHVIAAHVLEKDSRLDSLLVDRSLAAAAAWLFEPATRDGKPVSADHVIVFNFAASSR